ncbi:hypothetical protein D7231_33630 [Streptomyces klenkii]|uniref:Uncharacterized protein n=1 Tax=Streptomyces klenkii TaxID=1420899 RepID=A0A3B0AI64_9ACTN|nr:hypothetical protein [Streptomyces klenkii]RKN60021.1 hypothetical protein D7231_33630 [Streptomyces klenkii]
MPEADPAGDLRKIGRTRNALAGLDRKLARLRIDRARLTARQDTFLGTGDITRAEEVARRIEGLDADIRAGRGARDGLVDDIAGLSDGLLAQFAPEVLVTTLDGRLPVAMLPVRIETRFDSATRLQVRVFPDQVHIDAHDPALTADEAEGARWYWNERWRAGLEDAAAAKAAWQGLTSRFRPGRAAYLVKAMTPANTPHEGDPAFPDVPSRAATWSRAPMATALPDRFCVVGLGNEDGQWVERFRTWGNHVPDRLAVGLSPQEAQPAAQEGGIPVDEGTRWLREPSRAKDLGTLIEIEDPSLAQGVERLVVLGVNWTQPPDKAAEALSALFEAQKYAGHLGFVAQGTPTNNTTRNRSGYTGDAGAEAAALDPATPTPAGDAWSAGPRLARALGIEPAVLTGLPGAGLREHAWASALTDALWRGTAGHYLTDMLDPLAKDPRTDSSLREFAGSHVFASGPLPTLRAGAQPYGVLPVVAPRHFEPSDSDRGDGLVHRVAGLMRGIVAPAVANVPHLRRAGEDQDVDAVLLALLQRTPVPWTFRFRTVTGPVQRKNLSARWDLINAWQRSWTSAVWAGLEVSGNAKLTELTLGKDYPLPVPLVLKPGEAQPTGYLTEIADLTKDVDGRMALNLREDSVTLLEALCAYGAVLELDRCALRSARDRLAMASDVLETLPALSGLAVPTPETVRIEPEPSVPAPALDFRTGRQLADTVVPQVSTRPLGEFVTSEFAGKAVDLAGLLNTPTDPFYWLGRHQTALRTLAEAPPEQLEWAFRGHLDLFSTRLDAWLTGLATSRLAEHRASTPSGIHLGCWGMVEDLRHDTAAESLGFVHTPSLAQAVSTALLRNGRLANRGDDGAVFDLQVTSERVRRGRWLLQGVAHGQRLAALLGYRIERRLREAGLTMMRYQMPLRRTAPLRGPDVTPAEPVEVLAARDVVDGVTLLDRWRQGPDAVLDDIARQAGAASSASLPADDSAQLRKVIDDVYGDYDAVSDLLVAESVHQAALGNLDRSGAALSAHDRHDRAPGLDYIASPQSGHTVAHRVAVILQDTALGKGWPRDARGAAEPMLDAWIAQVLGDPSQWLFDARLKAPDGTETALAPVSLADLGIGPLSVALAAQKPGEGRPSELQQRIGLAFAAQTAAGPSMELELLADPPSAAATGGLALLTTLGAWVAKVAAAPPLTAGDFVSGADARGGAAAPGSIDTAELTARAADARARLGAAVGALGTAADNKRRHRALLGAVPFDGPDALPRVPAGHPDATAELSAQVDEVATRLGALAQAVSDAMDGQTAGDGSDERIAARQTALLRSMLGSAQPVLPRWTLTDRSAVAASLTARADLLGDEPTAPAAWLQRSALVRPELDALAGLLLHAEAGGSDVAGRLQLVQLPHRPRARWLALPFGDSGAPPHGSIGVVAHAWQPFNPARPFAGLVVDGWTETIPADTETTAVTFHYDAPGARAPQALLLAVHPARAPEKWSFELLLDTVNEAADLARLRTLSSKELAPMGSFLPALYLPDDYTRDVPSVSLDDLKEKAKVMATAAGSDSPYPSVLGKG